MSNIQPDMSQDSICHDANSNFPNFRKFATREECNTVLAEYNLRHNTEVSVRSRGPTMSLIKCRSHNCPFTFNLRRSRKRPVNQQWMIVGSVPIHSCSRYKAYDQTRIRRDTFVLIDNTERNSRIKAQDERRKRLREYQEAAEEETWHDGDSDKDVCYNPKRQKNTNRERIRTENRVNSWLEYTKQETLSFPGQVPDEAVCRENLGNFEETVSIASNSRKICSICGLFSEKIKVTTTRKLERYKDILQIPSVYAHVPQNMIYRPKEGTSLEGCILEPQGLQIDPEGIILSGNICGSCSSSLKKAKLPDHAYANEMWSRPIQLPNELDGLTWLEWKLISCSRPCVTILKLANHKGKPETRQRGYKASCVSYPQPIESLFPTLPIRPAGIQDFLRVVFTGNGRPIKRHTFSMLGIRPGVVSKALQYLQRYNPLYKNVIIDEVALTEYDTIDIDDLILDNIKEETGLDEAEHEGYVPNDELEMDSENEDSEVEGLVLETNGMIDTSGATIKQSEMALAGIANLKGQPLDIAYDTKVAVSGDTLFMPRSSIAHNEFEDTDFIARSYPELFHYGVGYPGSLSRKRVSLHSHLQHSLLHCSRAYGKHSAYMFHLFNIIQRRKSWFQSKLQIKRKDFGRVCESLKQLKPEDIEEAVGCEPKNYTKDIKLLLDKLYSHGASIQGSAASLRDRRREIQAMIVRYGPPHFYVTLNPADLHSPLLLHLAGEKISLNSLLSKSTSYRAKILSEDPVSQALFFDKIIKSMYQILFGFGRSDKKGVLGTSKGFYGVYETQGRGSLHIHSLIWLQERINIPKLRETINDENIQNQIIALLDNSVCQDASGVKPSFHTMSDIGEYAQQQLQPGNEHRSQSILTDEAIRSFCPSSSNSRTPVCSPSTSNGCRTPHSEGYGDSFSENCRTPPIGFEDDDDDDDNMNIPLPHAGLEIDSSKFTIHPSNIPLDDLAKMTDDQYITFCSERLQQLVYKCQMHKCTPTCWKKGKVCRFRYPRTLIEKTIVEMDPLRITGKRNHPKVNNYNRYIMLALKANHDIQALFGALFESMAAMYYMTNYCTKRGPSSHSMLSLMTTSVRSLQKETAHLPDEERVVRLIHRCYNTVANSTEFSAAHIATMALNLGTRGTHYTSHNFGILYTNQYYQYVQGIEKEQGEDDFIPLRREEINQERLIMEVNNDAELEQSDFDELENQDANCSPNDAISDYQFRGDDLQTMCLFEHGMFMYRRPINCRSNRDSEPMQEDDSRLRMTTFMRIPYNSHHPKSKTHIAAMRGVPMTLVLSGDSIPHSETDKREEYAMKILTLFKPWRQISDLKDNNQSWSEAFSIWQPEARIKEYIENIDALKQSEEDRKQAVQERFNTEDSSLVGDLNDCRAEMDEHFDQGDWEQDLPRPIQFTVIEEDDYSRSALRAAQEQGYFGSNIDGSSKGTLDMIFEDSKKIIMKDLCVSATAQDLQKQLKIQVQVRNNRDESLQVSDESTDPSRLNNISHLKPYLILASDLSAHHAEMQRCSDKYELNSEQTTFFRTVVQYVMEVESSRIHDKPLPEQLLLSVLGPGGTGKSYTINAILEFLHPFGLDKKIMIGAYTGSAANGIGGGTVHSLLGMSTVERNSSHKQDSTEEHTIQLLKAAKTTKNWNDIILFIIDEVSMIGCRFLYEINANLIAFRDGSEDSLPFGGLGMCFCGDFMQLEPVRDQSLLEPSIVEKGLLPGIHLESLLDDKKFRLLLQKNKALNVLKEEKARIKAYKDHHGRLLWLTINKVIFLTKIKRQEADIRWADLLGRLRCGELTSSDIELLQTRVNARLDNDKSFVPIIVHRNKVRHALNNRCIFNFAKERKQQVVAIKSFDAIEGLLHHDLNIQRITGPDTQFEGKCHILYLTKGCPVIITKNQHVELGLTNGAAVRFSSMKMSYRDEIASRETFENDPDKIYYLQDFPEYLTLDMCDENGKVRHSPLPGFLEHELPVMANKLSVLAKITKKGKEIRKSFPRTQFQLCLGFSLTDYKVQGKGYDFAIVDVVRPKGARRSVNSLYVMLSRVKTLAGLSILRPFQKNDICTKLDKAFVAEMKRLKQYIVR